MPAELAAVVAALLVPASRNEHRQSPEAESPWGQPASLRWRRWQPAHWRYWSAFDVADRGSGGYGLPNLG
jgi:hypothetical protein